MKRKGGREDGNDTAEARSASYIDAKCWRKKNALEYWNVRLNITAFFVAMVT